MMKEFFSSTKYALAILCTEIDLLREQATLVQRRKGTKPRTTFCYFRMKKYPNLIKDFISTYPN
jgi:hypothetical protein